MDVSIKHSYRYLNKHLRRCFHYIHSLILCQSTYFSEKLKLFNSIVLPILFYGSEGLGFHKALDIEKVCLKFLKQFLNVRQQTIGTAVYGKLGLFPLSVCRNVELLNIGSKY